MRAMWAWICFACDMELQASMRRRVGWVIMRFGFGFEFHFWEFEEKFRRFLLLGI